MPGARTAAAARLALDRHARLDRLAHAEHDLGQREVEHDLGVGAARRARLRRLPTERIGPAAEERVEEVVEPERAAAEVGCRAGPRVVGTEHVVAPPALGIAQRLVRGAASP